MGWCLRCNPKVSRRPTQLKDPRRPRDNGSKVYDDGYIDGRAVYSLQIEELKLLLEQARTKLQNYRIIHSGEYVGGREFQSLISDIEKALKC